jgi:ribonuclease HII
MRRVLLVGIDEVGRGAWAGPLYFGAVCFIKKVRVPPSVFMRDSKALNRAQRAVSARFIKKNTIFCVYGVPRETLDSFGLQRAMEIGIQRIVRRIKRKILKIAAIRNNAPEGKSVLKYLIDGRKVCEIPDEHAYIIGGDSKIREISAASIIAKVARDRLMIRLSKKYPGYGFQNHVGYGTREHQEALQEHGICDLHRRSYAPVHKIMEQNNSKVMHRGH